MKFTVHLYIMYAMLVLNANIRAFYRATYHWHLVLSLIRAELHLKVNA